MQVGTTKDQGLYNKPSAAVHPGALAAGTLPQYNSPQGEAGPSIFSLGVLCFSSFSSYSGILFMSILNVVVTFIGIVQLQKNVLHSQFPPNGLVSFPEITAL